MTPEETTKLLLEKIHEKLAKRQNKSGTTNKTDEI